MEEIGYFLKLSTSQCNSHSVRKVADDLKFLSGNIFMKIRGSRCRASQLFLNNADVIEVVEHSSQYIFVSPHVYRMRVKQTEKTSKVIMVDSVKEYYDYSLKQYQDKIKSELRLAEAAYKASKVKRLQAIKDKWSCRQASVFQSKLSRQQAGREMADVSRLMREEIESDRVLRYSERQKLRLLRSEIMNCLAQMNQLLRQDATQ